MLITLLQDTTHTGGNVYKSHFVAPNQDAIVVQANTITLYGDTLKSIQISLDGGYTYNTMACGGEYTINAYRKYIKDHYSTTGIAIAYGTTGDTYHYANVYDPLWRKSQGDGVDFITTVQPSYSEIATITGN